MRVLVIGSGATGSAVIRYAVGAGHTVTVLEDDPTRAVSAPTEVRVVRAADGLDPTALLEGIELVVPSPGVPERHPVVRAALATGLSVRSEIDLAGDVAAMPLVAVTGTNGKTTVTTLATAMLVASGVKAVAAGNIGRPLLDAVTDPVDVVVAEVSSFQLRFTTRFRPRVAVLLNVAPDHLDWHPDFDAYAESKARIFANQRDDDVLVFDDADPVARELARRAPARAIAVSEASDLLEGLVAPSSLDATNAAAAAAAARAVGASRAGILEVAANLPRLPHRVAPVGKAGGVRFFDDSKATNPHATLAAVHGLDAPVVLIAGGRNKGLDLGVLRPLAPRLRSVVAIGEAAAEITAAFSGAVEVEVAGSMRRAVRAAAARAEPGDAVVLSPACASFDWYDGYASRGDDFAREVASLVEDERSR